MGLFRRRNQVVRERSDGRFDIVLPQQVRDVLEDTIDQIDGLLDDPDLAMLRRLQPNPYPDDSEQAAAWRLLAGEQLRDVQRDSFATLRRIHASGIVGVDELWTWIRALNTMRLVLGTAIGIEEDGVEVPEPSPEDPIRPMWELYHLSTFVQYEIVAELSGTVES